LRGHKGASSAAIPGLVENRLPLGGLAPVTRSGELPGSRNALKSSAAFKALVEIAREIG